jgi:hypothetical protein
MFNGAIMKNKKIFLFLPLFFLILNLNLSAQGFHERKQNQDKEDRWNKIEEYKKLKMIEELKLSDEESLKFYSRYIGFRNQMKDLEKERRSLMEDLESITSDPSKQGDIVKKMDGLENVDQRTFDARKGFFYDIKKILPIEKVAKYIIFERKFLKDIQNIMKDLRQDKKK